MKPSGRAGLALRIMTATDLAGRYGVNPRRVRRAFKWWCNLHEYDPMDFFTPGVGYILPEEFVEYFEAHELKSVVPNEKTRMLK